MINKLFNSLLGNDEEKTCICGTKLVLTPAKQCYNNADVECDKCGKQMNSDTKLYHCNNTNTYKHEEGYDICTSCISLPSSSKMESLSLSKRREYLLIGYIRELSNNSSPSSINIEIMTYVPAVFMKFDICHKDNENCINNNGIQRNKIKVRLTAQQHRAMSDRKNNKGNGIRTAVGVAQEQTATVLFGSSCYFGNGINEWSFEIHPKPEWKTHQIWLSDTWGVTDNISICSEKNMYGMAVDVRKHVFAINYGGGDITKIEKIKIVLNCNDNTLTLYRNGWKKKSIEINSHCMYYPLIVSRTDNIEYKFLDE